MRKAHRLMAEQTEMVCFAEGMALAELTNAHQALTLALNAIDQAAEHVRRGQRNAQRLRDYPWQRRNEP